MFTATIKGVELKDGELTLSSDNRNYMRNLELLCRENKLSCVTTVEVKPRVVTFKGTEPTLEAKAKADAQADMKAADKVK